MCQYVCVYTRPSVALGPAFIPSPWLWPCFCQQWTRGSKEWGNRRVREGEEKKEKGKEKGGGRGCLHGQMDCSFSTHVEPCFVFHCRQTGAESIALLARAALSYCTPLSVAQRTHERTNTQKCKSVCAQRHTCHTNIAVFLCTHVKVITPAQR